jgi:hypothetical protein
VSNQDSTFSTLDPSDFPVLHRTTHSPFQQQHQQQLQQLQQQLRTNNFSSLNNGPSSAPILNSQSAQSLIMQLAAATSQVNSQSSSNLANSQNNLMMMSNSNTNLSQFNSSNMLHQSAPAATGSGRMWSNFGSSNNSNKSDFLVILNNSYRIKIKIIE